MTYQGPPSEWPPPEERPLPPEAYRYAPAPTGQPVAFIPGSDAANVPLSESRRADPNAQAYYSSGAPLHQPAPKQLNISRPDPSALYKCANLVSIFSTLFGILAIIGGIVLATTSETTTSGDFIASTSSGHPFVALGIGVTAVGVFQMLIVLMMAFWAKLYAETVYARMNGLQA